MRARLINLVMSVLMLAVVLLLLILPGVFLSPTPDRSGHSRILLDDEPGTAPRLTRIARAERQKEPVKPGYYTAPPGPCLTSPALPSVKPEAGTVVSGRTYRRQVSVIPGLDRLTDDVWIIARLVRRSTSAIEAVHHQLSPGDVPAIACWLRNGR